MHIAQFHIQELQEYLPHPFDPTIRSTIEQLHTLELMGWVCMVTTGLRTAQMFEEITGQVPSGRSERSAMIHNSCVYLSVFVTLSTFISLLSVWQQPSIFQCSSPQLRGLVLNRSIFCPVSLKTSLPQGIGIKTLRRCWKV